MPAPGWSRSTARYIAQNSAEAVEWLVERGVPFSPDPEGPLGLHLTREGGHAVRRIATHAADATGKAIHDVLLDEARAPEHHAARALDGARPHHQPASEARRAAALLRHLCAGHRPPARRDAAGAGRGAGHRRRRQGLPLHDESGHLHRRRHRDGLARRLPRRQHGVHPVPPDLPVPPPQERSFLITEALRGRAAS